MALREWVIGNYDKEEILKYRKEWNVPAIVAAVLYVRGFRDKNDVDGFLNSYVQHTNPFDFTDMDKLVLRVGRALENKEKICVYGDYDADGVTATALLYLYFKSQNADVTAYIPLREGEGYGLGVGALEALKKDGINLIITVDNGISACDEVDYAKTLGIDVIITDHHRVHEKLPCGSAVVDPYREESDIKYKNFAGVGVAYKAVQALESVKKTGFDLSDEYLDLVALGTIGDSIELVGESRDMVKEGLKRILSSNKPGIKELACAGGKQNRKSDSVNVAFGMVPRINAAGRLGSAFTALKLLTLKDSKEAFSVFRELDDLNSLRKDIECKIINAVEEQLENEAHRKHEKIIIAEGENWHSGVLGIAASRIAQKYGKPTVLITTEGENAKGSCRSVEGFSIHEALQSCSEYLDRFGGHPMAAGLNIKTKNIEKFKKTLINYADSIEDTPLSCLNIDLAVNPLKISLEMIKHLERLKPFGCANPEPVFCFSWVTLKKIRSIGGGNHLKIIFSYQNRDLEAVYFGKTMQNFLYCEGDIIDMAVSVYQNEYRGAVSLSIRIIDIKLSCADTKEAVAQKNVYDKFKSGKKLGFDDICSVIPTREDFVSVYKYLKCGSPFRTRGDIINFKVFDNKSNIARICLIMDIIKEMGITEIIFDGDEYIVDVKSDKRKICLEDSQIFKNIIKAREDAENERQL